MHACGHDGHTAIVLGAAYVLTRLREFLSGNVKLIFQPGKKDLEEHKSW
jgi:amidohydrolase